MSGDNKGLRVNRSTLGAFFVVSAIAALPAAAALLYQDHNGPKAYARERGYSDISLGPRAPGACGASFTLSRHFTATDRHGLRVEKLYCESPIFGLAIKDRDQTIATSDP